MLLPLILLVFAAVTILDVWASVVLIFGRGGGDSFLIFAPATCLRFAITAFIALLFTCVAAPSVFATNYYWDNNGAVAGFGTAAGTWAAPTTGNGTQGWSTDSTGSTLPGSVTTTTNDSLNFGTGSLGLGAGIINVSGTVAANKINFLAVNGGVILTNGIIQLGGAAPSITVTNDATAIYSAIALQAAGQVIFSKPYSGSFPAFSLNGQISGGYDLTFTTPNVNYGGHTMTVYLGAANTYGGNTTITCPNTGNALIVAAVVGNALPPTTLLTLDGGPGTGSGRAVTFDLNGNNQTLAGLSNVPEGSLRFQRIQNGSGTAATLTISNTADYAFSGNIIGTNLSLTKSGSGTQTLGADNIYTGNTIINAGNLTGVVTGSCSNSTVIVNSTNATLGVSVTANNLSWDCAALNASNAGTLQFNFGNITPSTSVSPLKIAGLADFSAATPMVSVIVSSGIAAGTYPLMTWSSVIGTPPTTTNLIVSTMAIGTTASLSVSSNTLNLVIASTVPSVGVASVQVENYADGSGVIVPATAILSGTVFTNFAIARDASGNYLSNTPVVWQLSNITGSVVAGDLEAAPDGKSAVFTANGNGSAKIMAQANATNLVASGVINVTNSLYTFTRPFIWARDTEKANILAKIATNGWAAAQFNALVSRTASEMSGYLANRDSYLRGLPINWAASPAPTFTTSAHGYTTGETYFNTALDCALLYYLTGKAIYARCAADILHNSVVAYQNLAPSTSTGDGGWLIPSDLLYEARQVGTQLPLVYDFLYQYLQMNQVYDVASAGMVNFNFSNAQNVFNTYYTLCRNHGQTGSNWSALKAPCMVNNLLALDNAASRSNALQVYLVTGTAQEDSLKTEAAFGYAQPGDIWPESLGYSGAVNNNDSYLMVMIERYDPSQHLFTAYPNIPLSLPRIDYLRYPNNTEQVNFGDSQRTANGTPYGQYEEVYQHALINGWTNLTSLFGGLINGGIATGNYNRSNLPSYFYLGSHNEPCAWLWAAPTVAEAPVTPVLPRTDTLPYAGIAIQRNSSTVNNGIYGLMCFVGGASHVHSHASGMSMELFGMGEVLGAKSGNTAYGSTNNENYYRVFASDNNVIVNGSSMGGPDGWAGLGMNTVQVVAMEPQPFTTAVSSNYSFTCSSFVDNRGTGANATEQRTLAIIRTSPTNGFYVDVFRSVSAVSNRVATTLNGNATNQFHDYIYRNVGDTTANISTNGMNSPQQLTLFSQPNRFQTTVGDSRLQPGWDFFSNTMVSYPERQTTFARFQAKPTGGFTLLMDMFIPSVTNREYAWVTCPAIVDAPTPYNSRSAPAVVIRQIGEAWNNAFAVVYEPHNLLTQTNGDGGTIQNVTALWSGNVVVGLKIQSVVGGRNMVHYVFSNTNSTDVYKDNSNSLSFKGRFGIVADNGDGSTTLYLGQGSSLSYRGNSVATVGGSSSAAEVRFVPGQAPSVTANSSVTVGQAPLPAFTGINLQPNGIVMFTGVGVAGAPFTLWASPSLSPANWVPVNSGTVTGATTNSPFATEDDSAFGVSARYYRLSTP
jgi:autotransporter-associated beta strand protein